MTFHFTKGIHINHAVFLHLYLLGEFLVMDSVNWIANLTACAIYCALFLFIFRFNIIAWIYVAIVAAISFASHSLHQYYLQPSDFDTSFNQFLPYIVGFACMLFALVSQQIGHCLFEKYLPPMSLFHGFVAAPFLEFMAYFVLLDCRGVYPKQLEGIQEAIKKRRDKMYCDSVQ